MKLFTRLFVTGAMLLATTVAANAADSVSKHIGQNYRGENILPIRQLLGLGPEYRGEEVDYVVLTASTAAGHGQAALLVNDQMEGFSQTVATRVSQYYFELSPGAVLGETIRSLQFQIRGNFYVERIEVAFKKNYIEKVINQRFRGVNTLKVRALLGIDQSYRGQRIKSVILTGSTAAGRGQAQLFVNDQMYGRPQVVGTRTRDYFFDLGFDNVIGQDIMTLQLDLQGNFYVEKIAVEFEGRRGRRDGGRSEPPTPPDRPRRPRM